jgi:RNA polymerase sigma-70 factor, ECF subfamily
MRTVMAPEALPDHLDRLSTAARALCHSREEAEDLVQDTFARVLAKRRELDGDPAPYLLRALCNCCVSSVRGRERRPATTALDGTGEDELAAATGRGLDEAVAGREVVTAIAALPEAYRTVVVAVDVVGLSYAETAAALEVPPGTVMSRLSRGRARVADQLRSGCPRAGTSARARPRRAALVRPAP